MSANIFVDTNVLVYTRDASKLDKQAQAAEWMGYLWSLGNGRLSMQVITEYYSVVTGKLKPGMESTRAREDVEDLLAWQPLPLTPELVLDAWQVQDLFHLSWWELLNCFSSPDPEMWIHLERGFSTCTRLPGSARN